MTRKSNAASVSGQHVSLAVAAHLVRTQLIQEPLKERDVQQTLDVVAQALARTAPLHVTDEQTGETRPLSHAELEGAVAQRGAAFLVLKDGRSLTSVSVRRVELREAITVLKAAGLPGIAPVARAAAAPRPAEPDRTEVLRARFAEVEALLEPPLVPTQVERAKGAAVWIARHAPQGRVANLAMQLMSALHEMRGLDEIPGGFRMALARLRAALEQQSSDKRD